MNRQDMVKDFLEEFNEAGKEAELPVFLEDYRILSCLYERTEKSCYMVADWKTDEKYLLKIRKCGDDRNVLEVEHQRIEELAQAFPEEYKPSRYWKENEVEYLLKCYIQGMDLEAYQERNGAPDAAEILRIAIEICKAVTRLHAMEPPVIHRDIKPKNLIIDYRGNVHLIDFETTRDYKEDNTKDTVFFGTEGNAAPEQYGYSQSDVRTDVYGIGKVLEFLYEENAGGHVKDNRAYRRIHKIIQKAAAFDPAKRYQSISQLQSALEKVMNGVGEGRRKRRLFWIGAVEAVAAVVLLSTAFMMKTEFRKYLENPVGEGKADTQELPVSEEKDAEMPTPEENGAELPEPEENDGKLAASEGEEGNLIFDGGLEQVLPVLLGKAELAEEDYDRITKIVVMGNQIYAQDIDLQDMETVICHRLVENRSVKGKVADLTELSRMKNLKEVVLCDQSITDISPLAGLPIETLYLAGNEIEDFSVVETLAQLKALCIAENPVSVLPDLSKCKSLATVALGGNIYENLDFLENSTAVTLYIENIHVNDDDFSVLERLPGLIWIYSTGNQYGFYDELPKLTGLKGLALWDYMGPDLSIIKSLPRLKVLLVSSGAVESIAGIEGAVHLDTVCIDNTGVTDISPIKDLDKMTFFKINDLAIEDYTPLFECESLRVVGANAEQKKKIESIDENPVFQIIED
ncbi:MAG: protein kinase [Bacteroidales bacterium]|nr:protein kinase [Clostridium sp.]MCM1203910.1 protein kinase [Bacteroidales bacterium]